MSKQIELNEEQQASVTALLSFLTNVDDPERYYVLSGSAGTGKTFLLKEVYAKFKNSHGKLAFTAPTNKAAKELRKVTGDACTIYSLLGLRITTNGEVKELAVGKTDHIDLSEFDGVVIDEAGMISMNLMQIICEAAVRYNLKIIFSGDRFQLPPIKERYSQVWNIENGSNLSRVMRHDNQILKLVTRIRDAMQHPVMNIDIKNDNDGSTGVFKVAKADFRKTIYNAALKGVFADGNKAKVIAWRNVKVGEYNQLIRSAIFGAGASSYEVGERIIAAAPCLQGDDTILSTDEEAIVESAIETVHPVEPRFKAIELKCMTERNKTIRLVVLHPDSQQDFDNACQTLAHEAKKNPKRWRAFWQLKELFHDIKYAYAITAHRSQGSTYETVYVDYQDILMNRERLEAFQCLYVACSRPTTTLILA